LRETIKKLVALQRVDDKLDRARLEVEGLPALREAADTQRAESQEALEAAREAVRAAELEQRTFESGLSDAEERKRHLEGQTSQVKSNEAYTALLREIEDAKVSIGDNEEKILEAMDVLEGARQSSSQAESHMNDVGVRVDRVLERLAGRADELAKEVERLTSARDAAADALDPEVRGQYFKIIEQRRRPALVIVRTEACTGCRVGIPPQDFVDLISAQDIVKCRTCKRILVHADTLVEDA
jgi:predicted  nucleic acid-binding Zn-ribbon protein